MCTKKLQAAVNISNDKEVIPNHLKGMYLEYYVIESEVEEEQQISYAGKSYGVEIVKKEVTKDNTTYMENKIVNDVYCCETSIKKLIDKLVYHTVTPIGLNNVLEDTVGVV